MDYKFKVGDRVKLKVQPPMMLPSTLSPYAQFIIKGKTIYRGNPAYILESCYSDREPTYIVSWLDYAKVGHYVWEEDVLMPIIPDEDDSDLITDFSITDKSLSEFLGM